MLQTATVNALKEQGRTIKNQQAIARMENVLAKEGLEWQKTVDEFNMKMAESIANKKDVFGRLGEFGTNIWGSTGGAISGSGGVGDMGDLF
jgi:hypothetical protein